LLVLLLLPVEEVLTNKIKFSIQIQTRKKTVFFKKEQSAQKKHQKYRKALNIKA